LLGVDQSVLLLKTGNDIEKSAIEKEIETYRHVDVYNDKWFVGKYYAPNIDPSDAVLLTNTKIEGKFLEAF